MPEFLRDWLLSLSPSESLEMNEYLADGEDVTSEMVEVLDGK